MRSLLFCFTLAALLTSSISAQETMAAPDFRLQDQYGEWHQLNDFSGQWLVVYFYPRADTPGCTTEACSFRDNIYAFRGIGAEVIGISTDPVDQQRAFSEKYRLPFAILSDESGDVAGRYGVLIERGEVNFARRETFLISPEGEVARHYENVNPDQHTEEVLADLTRLIDEKVGSGS